MSCAASCGSSKARALPCAALRRSPLLFLRPSARSALACRTTASSRPSGSGLRAIAALGPFDLGQAAVASAETLLALEDAGGTDAMLRAARRGARAGWEADDAPAGVLVKLPKPGQELRIDMPAIGPRDDRGVVAPASPALPCAWRHFRGRTR